MNHRIKTFAAGAVCLSVLSLVAVDLVAFVWGGPESTISAGLGDYFGQVALLPGAGLVALGMLIAHLVGWTERRGEK